MGWNNTYALSGIKTESGGAADKPEVTAAEVGASVGVVGFAMFVLDSKSASALPSGGRYPKVESERCERRGAWADAMGIGRLWLPLLYL